MTPEPHRGRSRTRERKGRAPSRGGPPLEGCGGGVAPVTGRRGVPVTGQGLGQGPEGTRRMAGRPRPLVVGPPLALASTHPDRVDRDPTTCSASTRCPETSAGSVHPPLRTRKTDSTDSFPVPRTLPSVKLRDNGWPTTHPVNERDRPSAGTESGVTSRLDRSGDIRCSRGRGQEWMVGSARVWEAETGRHMKKEGLRGPKCLWRSVLTRPG